MMRIMTFLQVIPEKENMFQNILVRLGRSILSQNSITPLLYNTTASPTGVKYIKILFFL